MWPPETVLLGVNGPVWQWHQKGVVVGHPGRVCKGVCDGIEVKLSHWQVSNRFGARSTLAMAIKMYDPFQRSV